MRMTAITLLSTTANADVLDDDDDDDDDHEHDDAGLAA